MTHTSCEGRELALYAANNEAVYRQAFIPAVKNLCRKMHKGTYNTELAVKLFAYTAEHAAKLYHKEFGAADFPWFKLFPPAARLEAAKELRDGFEAEYEANKYAGINPCIAA